MAHPSRSTAPAPLNVLVVTILPDDELPAVLAAFEIPRRQPPLKIGEVSCYQRRVVTRSHIDLMLTIACLAEQGITSTQASTSQLLQQLTPQLAILIGCACGRKGKTKIGDVVVSTEGVFYYEPMGGDHNPRPKSALPARTLASAVAVGMAPHNLGRLRYVVQLRRALARLRKFAAAPKLRSKRGPQLHFRMIASGEKILTSAKLDQLAKSNGNIYAGEKEGWGFAFACGSAPGLAQRWLVVRGVSDFGAKAQRERWKLVATLCAATVARLIVEGVELPRFRGR